MGDPPTEHGVCPFAVERPFKVLHAPKGSNELAQLTEKRRVLTEP